MCGQWRKCRGHNLNMREQMLHRVIEHELVTSVGHFKIDDVLYKRGLVTDFLKKRLDAAFLDAAGESRFGLQIDVIDQAVSLTDVHVPTALKEVFQEVGVAGGGCDGGGQRGGRPEDGLDSRRQGAGQCDPQRSRDVPGPAWCKPPKRKPQSSRRS